jgi:hypothetical protein
MSTQLSIINDIKGIVQDTVFSSDEIRTYMNDAQKTIAGGVLIRYPDSTQVRSSPLPDLATTSSLTSSTSNAYISLPSDYDRDLYFLTNETHDIRVIILSGLGELLEYYPALDNTQQVRFAAVARGRLYYQGMPGTAETMTAYYFRKPYDMASYGSGTISFTASTSKIADSLSGLDAFYEGQQIDVTGTTNNDGVYTVSDVASDGSDLTVSGSLTDEAAGSTFTIRSRPDGIQEHLHNDVLVNYVCAKIFERKSISDPLKMEEANRCKAFFNQSMLDLESSIERVEEPITFSAGR